MVDREALLVEIGTAELPPKALRRLMEALRDGLHSELAGARLEPGNARGFATPRRLAVFIDGVRRRQPDQAVERLGPKVEAAYGDGGEPKPAATGFARSCGVALEELAIVETDKGRRLGWRGTQEGRPAHELVPGCVEAALSRLPIPKRMRWGSGEVQFIRPVYWVVLLLGDQVVEGDILGIPAGRVTFGHRFHAPGGLELARPEQYAETLAEHGYVIADFDQRRCRVEAEVERAAAAAGGTPMSDEALADEVTALVEWPVGLHGGFDPAFLRVPAEALISSMRGHQRCFPVRDSQGRLLPAFVAVANIESRLPDEVRRGNERVIRPRLADAEFFWNQDRKIPLDRHLEGLRDMVFHRRLGSLYQRSTRIGALAGRWAVPLGGDDGAAERAGWLCKCDLLTEMVGEFPELQGVMGGYYAHESGEPERVAAAVSEHYRPAFAGDELPASPEGIAVTVADRADLLVGIFSADGPPTGDKDPFALRRAALGLLRCLIEGRRDVDLRELFLSAAMLYEEQGIGATSSVEPVLEFCRERLRHYYFEQGVKTEVFDAVAALGGSHPFDFHLRVTACQDFHAKDDALALASAHKRISNILRKAGSVDDTGPGDINVEGEEAEVSLALSLREAWAEAEPAIARRDYGAALARLARLRPAVDRFFDDVLVMAEDDAVRQRRLRLLAALRQAFNGVADISRLPVNR